MSLIGKKKNITIKKIFVNNRNLNIIGCYLIKTLSINVLKKEISHKIRFKSNVTHTLFLLISVVFTKEISFENQMLNNLRINYLKKSPIKNSINNTVNKASPYNSNRMAQENNPLNHKDNSIFNVYYKQFGGVKTIVLDYINRVLYDKNSKVRKIMIKTKNIVCGKKSVIYDYLLKLIDEENSFKFKYSKPYDFYTKFYQNLNRKNYQIISEFLTCRIVHIIVFLLFIAFWAYYFYKLNFRLFIQRNICHILNLIFIISLYIFSKYLYTDFFIVILLILEIVYEVIYIISAKLVNSFGKKGRKKYIKWFYFTLVVFYFDYFLLGYFDSVFYFIKNFFWINFFTAEKIYYFWNLKFNFIVDLFFLIGIGKLFFTMYDFVMYRLYVIQRINFHLNYN